MRDTENLAIIGSGPAGYTAALYAARANLEPLVIEGSQSGGALVNTTMVENYPGFPDGVLGPDLMTAMRAQAERFGARFVNDDVTSVQLTEPVKTIDIGGTVHTARAVILATGSAWRPLGVPGEMELLGRGVSTCATCDGFFFRGREIAVVGGGDSAMEEATFLTRFADRVTIVHRRDSFRASRIMAHRALADPKITVRWNSTVERILDDDGVVTGLEVRDVRDGTSDRLGVSGVFVAIGHTARSDLFKGQVALDDDGYVLVDHPTTRTGVDGVFAAGDLVDRAYRQAITAAGTGAAAGLDAERYLTSLEP
ncbi:thioredoxin-disulfide reductase [Actinoplanes sp. NPDC051470]|uniref:thioredoxin-disulfide reductase n=1 Tax=Actinoplanes sp. NPDC051470 TaxID=3157224 RepID=UPI00342CBE58